MLSYSMCVDSASDKLKESGWLMIVGLTVYQLAAAVRVPSKAHPWRVLIPAIVDTSCFLVMVICFHVILQNSS